MCACSCACVYGKPPAPQREKDLRHSAENRAQLEYFSGLDLGDLDTLMDADKKEFEGLGSLLDDPEGLEQRELLNASPVVALIEKHHNTPSRPVRLHEADHSPGLQPNMGGSGGGSPAISLLESEGSSYKLTQPVTPQRPAPQKHTRPTHQDLRVVGPYLELPSKTL
jgi:hypothetical protein